MRFGFLACAFLLCLLCSCGDKSAVSLSVGVEQATVSSKDGSLGATLEVGFDLKLEVGPEASGSATVSSPSFALQTADGAPIVDPLGVDTSTAFPVVVAKGGTQTVTFTLSSTRLLSPMQRQQLCPGPVVIVGSVMDSLKGGADPVRSDPILPTCT